MSYIGNLILETCAAASNSTTISLAGEVAGFSKFRSQHANVSTVYYVIRNATQWEVGVGTLTHATPDTLSRDTVLSNHLGTTARVTFTGSTYVYNAIPAEKSVYKDSSGNVSLGGTLAVTGNVSLGGTLAVTGNVSLGGTLAVTGVVTAADGTSGDQVVNFSQFAQDSTGPGYITFPGGIIMQWGPADVTTDGAGSATFSFPMTFPTACQTVIVANGGAPISTSAVHLTGFSTSQGQVFCPTAISASVRVAYLAIGK